MVYDTLTIFCSLLTKPELTNPVRRPNEFSLVLKYNAYAVAFFAFESRISVTGFIDRDHSRAEGIELLSVIRIVQEVWEIEQTLILV